MIYKRNIGPINECFGTLFKDFKRRNYFIRKDKYIDFQCIDYTYFYKKLSFKDLKECHVDTR